MIDAGCCLSCFHTNGNIFSEYHPFLSPQVCKVFEDTRLRSYHAEHDALNAVRSGHHQSLPFMVEANPGLRLIVTKPIVTPMSGRLGDRTVMMT